MFTTFLLLRALWFIFSKFVLNAFPSLFRRNHLFCPWYQQSRVFLLSGFPKTRVFFYLMLCFNRIRKLRLCYFVVLFSNSVGSCLSLISTLLSSDFIFFVIHSVDVSSTTVLFLILLFFRKNRNSFKTMFCQRLFTVWRYIQRVIIFGGGLAKLPKKCSARHFWPWQDLLTTLLPLKPILGLLRYKYTS